MPAGAPVPRQLPPATTHFTARHAELATLRALADRPAGGPVSVVISGIGGAAGVGKTALAVTAAHAVVDGYPDGQLFADLRGRAPDHRGAGRPVGAADVLGAFLRALGVPADRIPADTTERAGLYRSMLSGRRMIVLLDNAWSAEQVRPLLPGTAGCLVLVTGRTRLDGLIATEGAAWLPLEALPLDDAVELVARLVGPRRCAEEPAAVRRLAQLCDRLPLALRIAAARLVTHPDWPVAALVAALTDEHDRLDVLSVEDGATSVTAALSYTYAQLPAPAARLFRLLALHPGGTFTAAPVDALAGGPAAGLLAVLENEQLVIRLGPDRWTMHDLVAGYARRCVEADEPFAERATVVARLTDFMLRSSRAAQLAISPELPFPPVSDTEPLAVPMEFTDPEPAVAWLDAALGAAPDLVRQAVDHGAHALAWRLAHLQWFRVESGGQWDVGLVLATLGLQAARACGDTDGEYRTSRFRATALTRLGRLDEANAQYQELIELSDRLGQVDLRVTTMLSLGTSYGRAGRHDESVRWLEAALAAATEHDLGYSRVQALALLAHVHLLREEPGTAYECATGAARLCADISAPQLEGPTVMSMAQAADRLDRPEEAVELFSRALPIVRRARLLELEAEAQEHLADALRRTGRDAEAEAARRDALRLYTELGDPVGAARAAAAPVSA